MVSLLCVQAAPAHGLVARVLVDGRCAGSGAGVVSSLRLKHGAEVHVCSLASCDFIVSGRMAVEWLNESELANPQSRRRLQDRTRRLEALFDRVCLIVEKDRVKAGELWERH